jgi:hypothetical protein
MKIFADMDVLCSIRKPKDKSRFKSANSRSSASSESDERAAGHDRSFLQTAVTVKADRWGASRAAIAAAYSRNLHMDDISRK